MILTIFVSSFPLPEFEQDEESPAIHKDWMLPLAIITGISLYLLIRFLRF